MNQVTVTITTDKPVSVKITPCKDALDELLETLDGGEEEDGSDAHKPLKVFTENC